MGEAGKLTLQDETLVHLKNGSHSQVDSIVVLILQMERTNQSIDRLKNSFKVHG